MSLRWHHSIGRTYPVALPIPGITQPPARECVLPFQAWRAGHSRTAFGLSTSPRFTPTSLGVQTRMNKSVSCAAATIMMTAGLGLAGMGTAIDAQAQAGSFQDFPCPPSQPNGDNCDPPGPGPGSPGPGAVSPEPTDAQGPGGTGATGTGGGGAAGGAGGG